MKQNCIITDLRKGGQRNMQISVMVHGTRATNLAVTSPLFLFSSPNTCYNIVQNKLN